MDLGFDPNATLGILLAAILFSCFLSGMVTVQCYIYYKSFPGDLRLLKIWVASIWLLEIGHTICDCDAIYTMLITWYGDPEKILYYPQSLNVTIFLSGLISSSVQVFYARRIYSFSGQLYIPILCWILSFLLCIFGIFTAVEAFIATKALVINARQFEARWEWLLSTGLVLAATTDVIIALSLTYYFSKQRKVGLASTTEIIDRLIMWTIETGLSTSIGGVASVICFHTMKSNFVWIAIFTLLARVYANSFLALLNARKELQTTSVRYSSVRNAGSSIVFAPTIAVGLAQRSDSVGGATEPQQDLSQDVLKV